MKKVSIFSSLVLVLCFLNGCAPSETSDNLNQSNTNLAPTPFTEANQTNANVVAAETPLPVFTDANAALTEGKKLLDENKTEKAVEVLKQAVALNPDLAEAHFNLGIAYALLENETEQTPDAEPTPIKKGKKEVLSLTPSQKAFESATKSYEKITKKNPKDDAAFFDLGRSFNKLNKDKEAEKALRQAVRLKPDSSEYQAELGAILIKLARYDEALGILKKVLKLDENNSRAQDLLQRAEAGQKRQNYGIKPKPVGDMTAPKIEIVRPSRPAPKPRRAPKPTANTIQ